MNSEGDTIVEVLIAVAIVSLVLTSAYALTNRNVIGIQEAQEQAFAQKLVQQQVERLRASTTLPTTKGCFKMDGDYVAVADPGCIRTNGGADYHMSIDASTSPKYTVEASWMTLRGSQAVVTVYYEVAI